MKRKFRPFWTFRMESTQEWLSEMKKQGYELTKISRLFPLFTFIDSTKDEATYRLLYKTPQVSTSLTANGWQTQVMNSHWTLASNSTTKPSIYPHEEKSHKRKSLLYIIFIMILFLYLAITTHLRINTEISEKANMLFLVFNIFLVKVIVIVTYISSQKQRKTFGIVEEKFEMEDFFETNSSLLNNPFLMENWLKEMDSKGYRLLTVDSGRFLFKKKTELSKKYCYKLVFNLRATSSYFSIYQEVGWRVKYTTGSLFNITLWSKDYEGIEQPNFFEAKEEEIKSVKGFMLILFCNLCLFLSIYFMLMIIPVAFGNHELLFLDVFLVFHYAIFIFLLYYGRKIYYLFRQLRTIGTEKQLKKPRVWSLLILIGLYSIFSIQLNDYYRSYTPYHFSNHLEVRHAEIKWNDEIINIRSNEEEVFSIIKDIVIHRDSKHGEYELSENKKQSISFYFGVNEKDYILYTFGDSRYYLGFQRVGHTQVRVHNGEELHERLLKLIGE